jgi:hypothetical protein
MVIKTVGRDKDGTMLFEIFEWLIKGSILFDNHLGLIIKEQGIPNCDDATSSGIKLKGCQWVFSIHEKPSNPSQSEPEPLALPSVDLGQVQR